MAKKTAKELTEHLMRECSGLADETESGRMVADRKLAQSLIEYGQRLEKPEALVLAAEILVNNPVAASDATAQRDETQLIQRLLEQANEMRPGDKLLAILIQRFDQTPKAVRGANVIEDSAKLLVVRIDKGKHFRLSPDPVFEPQIAARVIATADGDPMLGITVRRIDLVQEKRWVARSRVSAVWNSGIYKKAWDIRVFNLSGPDGLKVRIETN